MWPARRGLRFLQSSDWKLVALNKCDSGAGRMVLPWGCPSAIVAGRSRLGAETLSENVRAR